MKGMFNTCVKVVIHIFIQNVLLIWQMNLLGMQKDWSFYLKINHLYVQREH